MSLRFVVVVLACAALAAAQNTFKTCPSATSTATDYFAAQSNCTIFDTCSKARCQCLGGTSATYSSTTQTCTLPTLSGSTYNCTGGVPCQKAFIQCMQGLAAANSATCTASLKLALMTLASGTSYNGSDVETACKADTCRFLNSTLQTNCTIDYGTTCYLAATPAPGGATCTVTIKLNGDFTAILAIAASIIAFLLALGVDLTALFGIAFTGNSLVAGSAVASMTAATSAGNASFQSALTALGTDSSWMTTSRSTFYALGGTGTFGNAGITAASSFGGSAAVFAWAALVAVVLAIFA